MEIPEIDVVEAKRRFDADEAVFVDVRDPDAFRRGHVPGALNVLDHNVADFVATADKTRAVVVYCYHGNSSLGGTAYFLRAGFEDVVSMKGGFEAWRPRYEAESGA
ncbi:MAG: thiosulfate sulfurtransferase GlpE [Myxococcales bacterium]|nr:thiosulfate sulfurtransferase GlpE [Myxococcales bacterium]